MYKRIIEEKIRKKFFKGKVIMIVGPRQVGKTTLSLELARKYQTITFNCDNPTERELLNKKDIEFLKGLVEDYEVISIDEAQKVDTIGETLKLLVDYYKSKKQIIVTGSSSINLIDNTNEPLTGRKFVFTLYPLSLQELYTKKMLELRKEIDTCMIYGTYPEVAKEQSFGEKVELIKELSSSYLYRDILEFQQVKNSTVIFYLLKALALQMGNEVSYNELARIIGIDKKTIEKYIDLLEKSFIVFRLAPYTKNKRKEISRLRKIYFYDLGIRNSIINNFNIMDSRNDSGQLFENFCILERMKYREYNMIHANQYFWRTYEGAEIDLVEEMQGSLFAYEIKSGRSSPKKPPEWKNYKVINKNNLKGFAL